MSAILAPDGYDLGSSIYPIDQPGFLGSGLDSTGLGTIDTGDGSNKDSGWLGWLGDTANGAIDTAASVWARYLDFDLSRDQAKAVQAQAEAQQAKAIADARAAQYEAQAAATRAAQVQGMPFNSQQLVILGGGALAALLLIR